MLKKLINNKIFLITVIIIIIALVAVGSYALLIWNSKENTELTFRIGDIAEVIFPSLDEDTNPNDEITINGNQIAISNIGPIFDYEKNGTAVEFSVLNLSNTNIVASSAFQVTTITNNLKVEDFKIAVLYSENKTIYTKISEVNFSGAANGGSIPLFSGVTISDKGYFKVIFYIDGNTLNDNSIQGGSLSGYITANAA